MTQPLWTPDFSRAPQSAHEMWQRVVSSKSVAAVLALNLDPQQDAQLAAQLGGATSKSAAILAGENLSPAEDEAAAVFMPDLARMARAIAAIGQPARPPGQA